MQPVVMTHADADSSTLRGFTFLFIFISGVHSDSGVNIDAACNAATRWQLGFLADNLSVYTLCLKKKKKRSSAHSMSNSNRITDKFLRHKLLMVTFWRVAAYKRGVNTTNWKSAYTRSVYWLTFWWNQLQLDWGYDAKTSAGRLEETAGAAPVVGTYGNSTWSDCFAPVVTLEKGKAPVCTRNKYCYLFLSCQMILERRLFISTRKAIYRRWEPPEQNKCFHTKQGHFWIVFD